MAELLKSSETPNLLDLVEACGAPASMLPDFSICADKGRDASASGLADLHSVCADKG
jgi:hypothetical protein